METGLIDWRLHTGGWLAAAALALLAAYAALDLSRGALSPHRPTSARALAAASLALSLGVCGAHFVALAGSGLPFQLHYRVASALAMAAGAYVASALGLWLAVDRLRRPVRILAGSVVLTALVCAVPPLLMRAVELHPPLQWRPGPWAAAVLPLLVLVTLAGALFARCRRPSTRFTLLWQAAASVPLALAVVGGTALATRWFVLPWDAVSPAAAGTLGGETLFVLSAVAVPGMLGLLLMSSVLEAHFRAALRRAHAELQVAAQTDPLTGLPNRTIFETWLLRATTRADRQGQKVVLLFANLDGLKTVNESFGQAAGDAVLREMGRRLRAVADGRETVARAGGDEFLLMLDTRGGVGAPDARPFAERLMRHLNEPLVIDERDIALSCSIGIAVYPEHGQSAQLIPHAAAAMRAAKRNGGGTCATFDAQMVAGARDQVDLLRDLRRAVQQQELELHYQPKVHAPSGQVTGAEALMRWRHPQRGMVGPHVFIPLAERFGLIHALGNWLIDESCRQIRAWADDGLRMRVAINLSVHQLRQGDLVDRIAGALAHHGVDPTQLTCEITETAAMEDTRATLQVIERLSALGVRLSIDDFGTGYSSLSYLRQLAAEELKIDRSFVMDLEASADARAIVDAVVKLAQALGMKVVAEGVETDAQQRILSVLGCDELQGYLFAKPMPADALTQWAMRAEGPRELDFRPSLFGDSLR